MSRRALTVAAIGLGLGLMATGCPNSRDDARTGDRVDVRDTASLTTVVTSTITSTTSTTLLTGARLDPCTGEPGVRSTAAWLPAEVPAGYELHAAWSITPGAVPTEPPIEPSPGPTEAPEGEPPYFLSHLVQVGPDGTMLALVELTRTAYDTTSLSGYHELEDEPHLTSVRGRAGRISSWINRSHTTPYRVARWKEAGGVWTATADVDAATLADWLSNLTLSGPEVVDRTGRLVEVGRDAMTTGATGTGAAIELRRSGAPADGIEGGVSISVSTRPTGTNGLDGYGLGAPGTVLRQVDGRWSAIGPTTVSAVLADGSLATIANAHVTGLTGDQLASLMQSLERVPADDPRLDEVPVFSDHEVIAPDAACRRTG